MEIHSGPPLTACNLLPCNCNCSLNLTLSPGQARRAPVANHPWLLTRGRCPNCSCGLFPNPSSTSPFPLSCDLCSAVDSKITRSTSLLFSRSSIVALYPWLIPRCTFPLPSPPFRHPNLSSSQKSFSGIIFRGLKTQHPAEIYLYDY